MALFSPAKVYLNGLDVSNYVHNLALTHGHGEVDTVQLEWRLKKYSASIDGGNLIVHLDGPNIIEKKPPKNVGVLLVKSGDLGDWRSRHKDCTCDTLIETGFGYRVRVMDSCPQKEHRL